MTTLRNKKDRARPVAIKYGAFAGGSGSEFIRRDGSVVWMANQSHADFNITNVGDISLDSISADGASITVTDPTTFNDTISGRDMVLTVANTDNKTALTINQNDVTNNPEAMRITQTAAQNALVIDANADCGNSPSVGGAFRIDNTGNIGGGQVIYSNAGATADGRLMVLWADNDAFDQQVLRIQNDGVGSAVNISQNTVAGDSEAFNIGSADLTQTTMGITGLQTGRGVLKVVHTGSAAVNASASAISVAVTDTSNDAQAIFVDCHTSGVAVNVDVNADTADTPRALKLDTENAGAGGVIGIDIKEGGTNIFRTQDGVIFGDVPAIFADSSASTMFTINQGGAGDIFELQDGGTAVFNVADGGAAVFRNFTDSTTGFQILDKDGGTPIFNVDTTNERVGIGLDNPGELLDVSSSKMIFGADNNLTSRTDATSKSIKITQPHYTNAEEQMVLLVSASTATLNAVDFGGGSASNNGATQLRFMVAPTTTTLITGAHTRILVNNSGSVGIGDNVSSPTARLHVIENSASLEALRVNQQGTADIAVFEDNGTEVFVVADGGTITAGLAATNLQVESDGDTFWTGEGSGIPFGNMYIQLADAFVVTIGDANPTEVASGADAWITGQLNLVTFTDHHLDITKAGKYSIYWSLSIHTDSGGNTEVHGGVMIDGVATRDNGESHRTVSNTNDTGSMCGVAVLDLTAGTEEISLWVSNDLSNDIHVNHATVVIKQIGGT